LISVLEVGLGIYGVIPITGAQHAPALWCTIDDFLVPDAVLGHALPAKAVIGVPAQARVGFAFIKVIAQVYGRVWPYQLVVAKVTTTVYRHYLELFDTGIGLAVRPHMGHGRAYRYGVYFFPSQLGVIKVYIVVHYIAILGGRPAHNGLAVLDAYAVQLYHIMVALV